MALVVECQWLGASRLPLHLLCPHRGSRPQLTLCKVGQPLPSSMGQLQSRVISEVVVPVALLSGIALSPEETIRYGRHHRKGVISLRSPSHVLRVLGQPLPPSLLGSSCALVTGKRSLCGIAPPCPTPAPCSLLIGRFSLLWPRAQWLGLVVGVSDLPPLPLTWHAILLVRFRWVYRLSFRSPATY